jgi:Mannosylglycerate hydrolase MGH1-like glycoside hydrolase domain
MKFLGRWSSSNAASPFLLQIAADARLTSTDYRDDQIWEVIPGSGESPALALQTHYGGRAGLLSLVPMWLFDGRSIYQAQAYAVPPHVTALAPGYVQFAAGLTPQLALQAEFWVIESHAVGARFTLENTHSETAAIHLDLIGFVGADGKEQSLSILRLPDGQEALALGKIGNLQPVVLLESLSSPAANPANPAPATTSPVGSKKWIALAGSKIGGDYTIDRQQKLVVRFVHAGLGSVNDSLALAQRCLQTDWTAAIQQIEAASQAIPDIETGDDAADAAIAYAYHQLVQACLKPTASLPYGSFVATRKPEHGFNVGDKISADRGWNGQAPTLMYPAALAMASIEPQFAQGIIRNYLAVQQADGWIDSRPGLGGQKQGLLCMPVLARLAWGIFQYTEDSEFLRDVFPGLLKLFRRWFQPDMDQDGDGLPEWQSEVQTGYVFTPTFAAWQGWAQGADIRCVESPDLVAYLLSEARSLKEIAYYLREAGAEQSLNKQITDLTQKLESLWQTEQNRYSYRDRNTHLTAEGVSIIHDARGNDELLPAQPLTPPNRLIVKVAGGVNLAPRMTVTLEGLDAQGAPLQEQASGSDFLWAGGRGVYTSQRVFAQIDRVTFEGLSRVYRIDVNTLDTTGLDINALLPLWSGGIPTEHAAALLKLAADPEQFWRKSGISMNSAQDKHYDPTNANGSGGVWPFWVTLIGEGLIELGEIEKAAELFKRLLGTQAAVLKAQKTFSEFYHTDEPKGLGESGHLAGIVPLHLMQRIFGVRIISSRKVWAGGVFFWDHPITFRQHGVVVKRMPEGTHIEFPSGHQVDLAGDVWQEVSDPNA